MKLFVLMLIVVALSGCASVLDGRCLVRKHGVVEVVRQQEME